MPKVAASVFVLVCLALTACGGGGGDTTVEGGGDTTVEGGGGNVFEGDGYSFTYPGDWGEKAGAATNTAGFDVAVGGPEEAGSSFVSLGVLRDILPEPITDANIDVFMRALLPVLEASVQEVGNVFEGDATKVSYGGLPGFRYEASTTEHDPEIHYRNITLFDGTTQYVFNCQFIDSEAEEIERACDQVLESFQVE